MSATKNISLKGLTNDEKVQKILNDFDLNFEIIKAPLKGVINVDGKRRYFDSPYYGLYNSVTDHCISTVKEGYRVSQNQEVIEMVLQGMTGFGDEISVFRAGALNGGAKVFVQLELTGLKKMGKGDAIKQFVTIIDSNDGSTGLSVGIGDVTMSCTNQFFRFYKKGKAKFRHTQTLEEKIKTIPELIHLALAESVKQVAIYKKFQSTPASWELANSLVKEILGHDRLTKKVLTGKAQAHMANMYKDIETEVAQKGLNLWGLHSGITSFTTHTKIPINRVNGLEESLMTGTSYKMAETSFNWTLKKAGIRAERGSLIAG